MLVNLFLAAALAASPGLNPGDNSPSSTSQSLNLSTSDIAIPSALEVYAEGCEVLCRAVDSGEFDPYALSQAADLLGEVEVFCLLDHELADSAAMASLRPPTVGFTADYLDRAIAQGAVVRLDDISQLRGAGADVALYNMAIAPGARVDLRITLVGESSLLLCSPRCDALDLMVSAAGVVATAEPHGESRFVKQASLPLPDDSETEVTLTLANNSADTLDFAIAFNNQP